jgi:hypothetical protein
MIVGGIGERPSSTRKKQKGEEKKKPMIGGSQLQKRAKKRGINREIKQRAGPLCLQYSMV